MLIKVNFLKFKVNFLEIKKLKNEKLKNVKNWFLTYLVLIK